MNAETGTALAIPADTGLADVLKQEDALEATLSKIEAEARSHAPDLSSVKGRKAIASLAYKIAQTKTALDNAGKEANAGLRTQIETVDAARRKVRDRLDALKTEIRQPLDDWEAAEEKRVDDLKVRVAAIGTGGLDSGFDPAEIAEALDALRALDIGEYWQEFREEAAARRDAAVQALTDAHRLAVQRVEQEAELAKLRAEAEERRRRDEAEAEERARLERERQEAEAAARRKAEEEAAAAERLKERAAKAKTYINQIGLGMIGDQAQPFGILIYELETKLPPMIDELGEHAADLHDLRTTTLSKVKDQMEKESAEREAREAQERAERAEAEERARKEAAEQAAREAEERHKRELEEAERRTEEAAENERRRIAAEAKAAEEARAKREADEAHRTKIAGDIAEALRAMSGRATPEAIAEALIAGKIPHVKVML